MGSSVPGRVRVERGIYRQPNGKYAVCWRHAGRLRFHTVGFDVAEERRERLARIAATGEGKVPVAPRLPFETVVDFAAGVIHNRVLLGVITTTSSARPGDGRPRRPPVCAGEQLGRGGDDPDRDRDREAEERPAWAHADGERDTGADDR
jgi:hypothetical protein